MKKIIFAFALVSTLAITLPITSLAHSGGHGGGHGGSRSVHYNTCNITGCSNTANHTHDGVNYAGHYSNDGHTSHANHNSGSGRHH